jgi:hypothetical protein
MVARVQVDYIGRKHQHFGLSRRQKPDFRGWPFTDMMQKVKPSRHLCVFVRLFS